MTIKKEGRRYYLIGNTYAIRDRLKAAGCHWDPGRRAWWTGDRAVAECFTDESESGAKANRESETVAPQTPIIGRAKYRDREYYVLWEGWTRRGGRAAKLAFRDGSRVFWADGGEYSLIKRYDMPITFARLQELAAEYRAERAEQKRWQAAREAEAAAYAAALAPAADYRRRHGALYGGTVALHFAGGDEIAVDQPPVSLDLGALEWQIVATRSEGQVICGRPAHIHTLYRAVLPDGRPVFRETHDLSYGDDLRETYHLPPDVYEAALAAEAAARGITPEAAEAWLTQYRGCVDTELYEFVANEAQK